MDWEQTVTLEVRKSSLGMELMATLRDDAGASLSFDRPP